MRRSLKIPLIVVGGLLAAILLVLGGFLLGARDDLGSALRGLFPVVSAPASLDESYQLQQEVLDKIDANYYKAVDDSKLQADAIDGMVAGLDDPYTVYWDPEEYASFKESSSGAYTGVGMSVEMKDHLVTVVSTFKGSPAEQAGIKPGDIITAVDGESVQGLDIDEVVSKIKGVEGTGVEIELYRPPPSTTATTEPGGAGGESETTTTTEPGTADVTQLPPGGESTEYSLTRRTIEIPVTETEILQAGDKKVAHISFYTFSQGSAAALRSAVKEAVEVEQVDAIILDLRSNGGGLLDQAVDVASIFIPEGEIVSTEGLHSPRQVYEASGQAYTEVPLFVLTDPYTASASEIVAGALQDYKRATLVGETTFGKGLVQSISALSNGGALKLTTAVYLTPLGRDINKKGISPDVVAPDDPTTGELDETIQKVLQLIASGAGTRSATSTTAPGPSATPTTTPAPSTVPTTSR